MKERPILFSGPMVRAILAGRKTQTRRIVTPQPEPFVQVTPDVHHQRHPEPYIDSYCDEPKTTANPRGMSVNWHWWTRDDRLGRLAGRCRFGVPGDRLWVRETWAVGACADLLAPGELHEGTWLKDNGGLWFAADESAPSHPISPRGKWRPSIFMPRWASRLTLEVVAVRVERLQGISRADAAAEGMCYLAEQKAPGLVPSNWPEQNFAAGWDTINGKREPWATNPWVWVLEFRRVDAAEMGPQ